MLQHFLSVSDHFTTLRSKGLRMGQEKFVENNLKKIEMIWSV